jgi:beta-galactosidase
MDIFRLPKFSYYFFKSQRDLIPGAANKFAAPLVYIANYWTEEATNPVRVVRVFSNCEKVALYLNEQLLAVQDPDTGQFCTNLAHPPFTFKIDRFIPGRLRATGMTGEKEMAEYVVCTPGRAERLDLDFDLCGKALRANGADVIFVYARIVDAAGTVVPDMAIAVEFRVTGPAELLGTNPVNSEAGIAAILLKASTKPGLIKVNCSAAYEDKVLTGNGKVVSY